MKIWQAFYGGIATAIIFASAPPNTIRAEETSLADQPMVYQNMERTVADHITKDGWQGAQRYPKAILRSQENNPFFGEVGSHAVNDCSNVSYRCLYSLFHVYAVPRARLSPAGTYVVAGAAFKIEDCIQGDKKVCQVALISSQCLYLAAGEACSDVPDKENGDAKVGPVVYFIYNEDFGVTAYGVATKPVDSSAKRRAVCSQMVLTGSRGLLAN